MRIPIKRVELKDIGYPDYFVDVPRSVTEGWLYAMNLISNSEKTDIDKVRDSNLLLLDTITAWNLDGDDNEVFPLPSTVKAADEKTAILSQIPLDILQHIATSIAITPNVPEPVKDF